MDSFLDTLKVENYVLSRLIQAEEFAKFGEHEQQTITS